VHRVQVSCAQAHRVRLAYRFAVWDRGDLANVADLLTWLLGCKHWFGYSLLDRRTGSSRLSVRRALLFFGVPLWQSFEKT